ncbi:MAG: MbcA/ParS/Xre antitoxin family protein [Alphaproteobacteria bacterium]
MNLDFTVIESNPASYKELSGPALRSFFNIAEAWQLTVDESVRLLAVPRSTYFGWKREGQGQLSHDTLERISYILGIYKALQILLPDTNAADSWIKKPNQAPLFAGRSALERMLSGNVSDLFVVRQYLDNQRGSEYL